MQQQQNSGASTANSTRVVTVVSTKGEKVQIEFTGTKWADLRSQLNNKGYDTNSLKAVESINKTTLEHDEAIVPDGDFRLYLMPYKSKAGGAIREQVKVLFAENKDAAKAHFGNYTQKKETELEALLATFPKGTSPATAAPLPPKEKKPLPASTKEKKERPVKPTPQVSSEKPKSEEVASNKSEASDGPSLEAKVDFILNHLGFNSNLTPTAKKAKELSDREIDEEMNMLKRGFKDVKQ